MKKNAIKIDMALVPDLENAIKSNVAANEYGDLKTKLDQAINQGRKSIAGIETHTNEIESISEKIKKQLDSIGVDHKNVPALAQAEKRVSENKSFVKTIDAIIAAIKSKGY